MTFVSSPKNRLFPGWLICLMAGLLWPSAARPLQAGECLDRPWPHEISDIAPDPGVVFGRLENGFRYALLHNEEPADRVSVRLYVGAGSLHEKDDQQGMAHFLEHMMFNGSRNFPQGDMIAAFQEIGIDYGSDLNARTGYDRTIYDLNLPAGDPDTVTKGLTVVRDWAEGASLPPASIEREKKIILSEKREQDSIDHRMYLAIFDFLYAGTALPQRHPIGSEKIIAQTDQDLLRGFYDRWYRPDNLVLVMVGDFDVQRTKPRIKRLFAGLKERGERPLCPTLEPLDHTGVEAFYHYEKEAQDTTVIIANQRFEPQGSPTRERLRRELKEVFVTAAVNLRLSRMLERDDVPPFYSAFFDQGEVFNSYRKAMFSASCPAGKWQETITVLTRLIEQIGRDGFLPEEINFVRRLARQGMERAVDRQASRNSFSLSNEIVGSITENSVFTNPAQDLELYTSLEGQLTPAALHAAFRQMWPADHQLLIVAGNADLAKSDGTEPAKRIIATRNRAKRQPASSYSLARHGGYPYLPPPPGPARVEARTEITDLGISQLSFANGLKVNIKRTDFDEKAIFATLRFGNGALSAPGPGFDRVGSQTLNFSGLGGLPAVELAKSLADTNTWAGYGISSEAFTISGSGSSGETEELFRLIYHLLLDPGFRPAMMTKAKQRLENTIRNYTASVDYAYVTEGYRFLMGGNPLLGLPTLEEISEVDFAGVKAWIDENRLHAPLELSVIGDFDEQEVLDLAGKYFGALPPRFPLEEVHGPLLDFPEGERLTKQVATDIDRATAMVAWPILERWDIRLRRKLTIMATVLENRFLEQLREKQGVAYSPGAFLRFYRVYENMGFVAANALLDPPQVDNFIRSAENIATDLCREPITEAELRRAVQPVLKNIEENEKSNSYWLDLVMEESSRHPEQFDWYRTMSHDYASVSGEDVRALACRFLDNEHHAVIIGRPEKHDGN